MLILANLFEAIAVVLDYALTFYMWIVVAGAVLSWVSPDPYNPIVRFLWNVTEPVYRWIRRYIPTVFGGFDIAPIILILALQFLEILINNIIISL